MHLKRLIVHGFKSFADRTEFEFTPGGLTCVVGPNGCGKSNVIDAVKWVLGEQRPTSLRGKEMTDVIFNGTVRRPPMGLCEGSLVFDNTCRTLGEDDDTVRVTRRVFRTGETEYQINGRGVRLKDVRDLFAGTGLGTGGYAFMEQGKIDSVLAGNAVERRRVFEEAAGISRFRARKHETGLKLDKVEENLTRLADVVEEIQRQIRSLRVHAGKARSHREMSARVQVLQRRFSLHRYECLSAEQETLAAKLGTLSGARDEAAARRDEMRATLHGVETELEQLVEAVSQAREEAAAVAGRVTAAKDKIAFHDRYQQELAQRLEQKRREIADARDQLEALREEQVVVLREREALERDLVRVAGVRGLEEQQVEAVRGRGDELEIVRARAESDVRELEGRLSGLARREARLDAEIGHQDERLAALEQRLAKLEGERAAHRAGLEERTGTQDARTSALEARRCALTDEEKRSEDLDQALADAADALRRVEGDVDRLQARCELLHGVLRRREGLDEGTRAVLEAKERDPAFLPGFRGLLLDLFEVDLVRARAIEAALGDAASAIVVASVAEALEGLRFLGGRGLGGALFLPLDRFDDVRAKAVPGVEAADPAIARVLAALADGIAIVPAEEFDGHAQSDPFGMPLLVSDGGAVLRDGRVLHAPRGGDSAPGPVVLHAELKELERELPGLIAGRDAARERVATARSERDASRARVKELSVNLVKEEGEAARLDQEIVRLVRELERLNLEVERAVEERSAAEQLQERARAELAELRQEHAAAGEALARANRDLEAHRERVAAHRHELERAVTALHAARMDEAKTIERLAAMRERGNYLAGSQEDLERRVAAAEKDRDEIENSQAATLTTLAEERSRLGGLEKDSEDMACVLVEREGAADGVRENLRAIAEKLAAVEGSYGELSEEIAAARGREGELRAAMESLLAHATDELQLDLVAAWNAGERAEGRAPPAEPQAAADEEGAAPAEPAEGAGGAEAAAGEVPSVEVAAQAAEESGEAEAVASEPVDWKAVEVEIRELRERIVRLGNVNLAAVEELEEAEKRAEFLLRERGDLEKSREHLKSVLKSIEAQSTAMFLETFNAVREHFAVIFRKLFGGGKADISLENPELPLETGIEVKARPPGKELRSITLLSGGERSMTAVALLFAIFRAHPAPCAFMDEVDAALDEDNTERFVRLVEESREQAQFIVVTHSKRTMEHANLLYGVTMPERGVSRRVAVKLEHIDDQGRIRDIEALNREAARQAAAAALVEDAPAEPKPAAVEAPNERASADSASPTPAEEPVGGDAPGAGSLSFVGEPETLESIRAQRDENDRDEAAVVLEESDGGGGGGPIPDVAPPMSESSAGSAEPPVAMTDAPAAEGVPLLRAKKVRNTTPKKKDGGRRSSKDVVLGEGDRVPAALEAPALARRARKPRASEPSPDSGELSASGDVAASES